MPRLFASLAVAVANTCHGLAGAIISTIVKPTAGQGRRSPPLQIAVRRPAPMGRAPRSRNARHTWKMGGDGGGEMAPSSSPSRAASRASPGHDDSPQALATTAVGHGHRVSARRSERCRACDEAERGKERGSRALSLDLRHCPSNCAPQLAFASTPCPPGPSLRQHPRSPMGCCAAHRAAVTIHLPSQLRLRARTPNDTGWPRHEADRASWGAA